MLVLVNRACTFLLVACVGACLTQAAAATELKDAGNFPPTPPQPQKPDWAGFYLRKIPAAVPTACPWTIARALERILVADAASAPVNENFGYNFQSGNFVFGLEGSLAAANFDGKFTSPYLPAMPARGRRI